MWQAMESTSVSKRWEILQHLLVFEVVIGFAFFFSTFFVSGIWGSGASLQVVSTAGIHLAYCAYLLLMVKQREIRYVDFVAGVSAMLSVMLFQCSILWGDFAGGLEIESQVPGSVCEFSSGSAERIVSAFCVVCFICHVAFCVFVYAWKDSVVPLVGNRNVNNTLPKTNTLTSANGYQVGSGKYSSVNASSASIVDQPKFVISDDETEL